MFFFVWFFVPETKGVSLEHMDKLFGVTDYDTDKNLVHDNASDTKVPAQVQIETTNTNDPYNHVRKESA